MKNNEINYELKTSELHRLSSLVKERSIWFHTIELDYRKKQQMLIVRFVGARDMLLSDNYVQNIEEQLYQLQKLYITPLIRHTRANFVLSLSVNGQGCFSFLDASLTLKIDCGKGINMHDSFREPFAVILPFAYYVTHLEFRGHKHRVAVVESNIKINPSDLSDVVNHKTVAPQIRQQWFHIASQIYEEAKEDYHYNVTIPCIEGNMHWDNKIETIQFTLHEKDKKMKVL